MRRLFLILTLLLTEFLFIYPKSANAVSLDDLSKKMEQTCKALIKEFQAINKSGGTFCDIREIKQPPSKRYEDIKVQIDSIELEVFESNERAKKRLESMDEFSIAPYSDKTRTTRNTKLPQGFIFVTKDRLKQLEGEYGIASVILGQQNGLCALKIYSGSYADLIDKYHVFSVNNDGVVYYDNKHPGFYHDREEELRRLAQSAADKVWNISTGLCGAQKSNERAQDNKEYVKSELDKRPKVDDFTKVTINEFTKVYPVSTISATPSPKKAPKVSTASTKTMGDIFIGKIGDEGKIDVELPDKQTASLRGNKTGIDTWEYFLDFYQHLNWDISIEWARMLFEMSQLTDTSLVKQDACLFRTLWYIEGIGKVSVQAKWDKEKKRCLRIFVTDGFIRVLSDEGNLPLIIPNGLTVMPNKADFLVGFNSSSQTSVIEVYDGSLVVKNKTGSSKTIASAYDSEIKRLEIDMNGTITEKIAIPKSEWEEFLTKRQEKSEGSVRENTSSLFVIMLVLIIGGITILLYRAGKLLPVYKKTKEKIIGSIRNIKN